MTTPIDVIEGRARWCVVCADNAEVLPTLPVVDAVVTDPPYGIGAEIGTGEYGKRKFNNDKAGSWDASAPDLRTIVSAGRRSVVFGGNYFTLPPSRCWLIWDKGAGFKGRDFSEAEMAWCSFDAVVRVLSWDPLARGDYRDGNKVHPTQKPVGVMAWVLELATKPGDLVLDPFAGSGTTGVACLRLGRRFIGIERDAHYAAVARERLAAESQGLTLRDSRAGQLSLLGGLP